MARRIPSTAEIADIDCLRDIKGAGHVDAGESAVTLPLTSTVIEPQSPQYEPLKARTSMVSVPEELPANKSTVDNAEGIHR